MKTGFACLVGLSLASCYSADAGEFGEPLTLTGTEPFWGGEITRASITLERAERPDRLFPPSQPQLENDGARWTSRSVDGEALIVSLQRRDCSDDMSERIYPFTAMVRIGGEILRGCAARTDAWKRAGERGRVE